MTQSLENAFANLSELQQVVDVSPQIPLGKRLMTLRQKAITEGIELLTTDEILTEIKRRHCEI